MYRAKNHQPVQCNVVVKNRIEQRRATHIVLRLSAILFNVVDNYKRCGQHNIVGSYFM